MARDVRETLRVAWALTHPPRRPTCPGRRLLPRLLPGVRVPPRAAPTARREPAGPRLSCGGRTGREAAAGRGRPRRGRTRARPGRERTRRPATTSELGARLSPPLHVPPSPEPLGGTPGPRGRCPRPQVPCRRSSQSDIPSALPLWGPCSPLRSPRSIRALLVLLSPLGNSWSLFDHSWSFPGPQFWEHFRLFRASLGIPSLLSFPRFWAS